MYEGLAKTQLENDDDICTMILNALTNSSSLWKDLGIHMIQLLTAQDLGIHMIIKLKKKKKKTKGHSCHPDHYWDTRATYSYREHRDTSITALESRF